MAHWILKSEPDSYSWDDLVRDGETEWTGVRNHAAAAHLRVMKVGDTGYFYHSGAERACVGRVKISRTAQKDGDEGNWVSVAVKPDGAVKTPVTLAAIKAEPRLAEMALVRQSRLSVSPVSEAEWTLIEAMAAG
jgi:predicted RNA-binding protein with PUA-like domain